VNAMLARSSNVTGFKLPDQAVGQPKAHRARSPARSEMRAESEVLRGRWQCGTRRSWSPQNIFASASFVSFKLLHGGSAPRVPLCE